MNRVIQLIKHLARIVRLYSSYMEATLNILYREDLLASRRIGLQEVKLVNIVIS
jgi:hypothetical protein